MAAPEERLQAAAGVNGAGPLPDQSDENDDGGGRRKRVLAALLRHAQASFNECKESDARSVAPYCKSQAHIIEFVLPRLGLTSDSVLFDLGCGDGRWLVLAAERYGCRCVGLEILPEAAEDARRAVVEAGVEHLVTVREEDFFKIDYSSCTAVIAFIGRAGSAALAKLLRTALKPGIPVVAIGFHLPTWIEEANYRQECNFPVYMYRSGSPVAAKVHP